jgi:hypothetical protein
VSFAYSDMDQLILQRWPDVMGLIDAHRGVQERIEEMLDIVGERIARWAHPLGFETSVEARDAEFHAWRPGWSDRRKGPKVTLALGGVCPAGFRKVEAPHPYQWVYIRNLADFRVKDAERAAFSQALRASLGELARRWEAEDVDDLEGPLGHYLTGIGNMERAQLVSKQDSLFTFATENLQPLFQIADVVEAELVKLGK